MKNSFNRIKYLKLVKMMQLYDHIEQLPQKKRVVVLGNFDGIHLGHRELLKKACAIAASKNLPLTVFTFFPQAQEIFDKNFAYLASQEEKCAIFAAFGVDEVLSVPFDEAIAKVTPVDFAFRILASELNAAEVVVGFNYTFGYKGAGKAHELKTWLADKDITVHIVPQYEVDGEIVSSSVIRTLLRAGEIEKANRLLGRAYDLAGEVVKGRQVGRTIGIPTANIAAETKILLPKRGVYAAKAYLGERVFLGVLNIGKRPTVHNGNDTTVEVHLLDFHEDIYCEILRVEFYSYLRGETRFNSLDELKAEIERNMSSTRAMLG